MNKEAGIDVGNVAYDEKAKERWRFRTVEKGWMILC